MMKPIKYLPKEWRIYSLFTVPIFLILLYIDFQFTNIGFLQLHSIDDYVFHGSLRYMYEGLVTGNIRSVFGYGFYQYGFIYFFLNLVVTLPAFATENTALTLALPRVVTSLFAIGSLIFIYRISRAYVSALPSCLIVLTIITMPAFWFNATWFHPDWSMTFFLLGFVYFLTRDQWEFKKNFWVGVVFYALAIACKYQAITAMPLLLLYVFYNPLRNLSLQKNICQAKLLLKSFGLILAVFVLSNPFILHPIGWKAFSGSFLSNMQSNATNHGNAAVVTLLDKIDVVITAYYMHLFFFAFLLGATLYVSLTYFTQNKQSIHAVIAINFLLNLAYLLFFVNKGWQHYYLPVFMLGVLPLLYFAQKLRPKTLLYALILIIFTQGVFFMGTYKPILFESQNSAAPDFNTYTEEQNKEINAFIIETLDDVIEAEEYVLITPYTPFEYELLGMEYENVRIIFGSLTASNISLDAYVIAQKEYWGAIKSEDEIAKSFKPVSYIILRKDVPFIDTKKINLVQNKKLYTDGNALVAQLYNGEIGYTVLDENEYVAIFEHVK